MSELSARVVWLGHGTLRRLLPSDDGVLSSPRPMVSSTSNVISLRQEPTAIFACRRRKRAVKLSLRREPDAPADFFCAQFCNVTAPAGERFNLYNHSILFAATEPSSVYRPERPPPCGCSSWNLLANLRSWTNPAQSSSGAGTFAQQVTFHEAPRGSCARK